MFHSGEETANSPAKPGLWAPDFPFVDREAPRLLFSKAFLLRPASGRPSHRRVKENAIQWDQATDINQWHAICKGLRPDLCRQNTREVRLKCLILSEDAGHGMFTRYVISLISRADAGVCAQIHHVYGPVELYTSIFSGIGELKL